MSPYNYTTGLLTLDSLSASQITKRGLYMLAILGSLPNNPHICPVKKSKVSQLTKGCEV